MYACLVYFLAFVWENIFYNLTKHILFSTWAKTCFFLLLNVGILLIYLYINKIE